MLNGYENKETASVIKEIDQNEYIGMLVCLDKKNLTNYGDKDLIAALVDIFESDTTEEGFEIGYINCDEVREHLDEL